jgi:hypothetical protein
MKYLLRLIAQKLGIKRVKPVQTVDYTLMAGSLSKKIHENLEKH